MTREELLKVAKPILFNTDMVQATLDGRKTVTRRIIKPQPKMKLCYAFAGCGCGKWMYSDKDAYKYWGDEYKRTAEFVPEDEKRMWTPPYHTDDILYVRETWQIIPCIECGQDEYGICHSKKAEYEDGNSITEGCFVFKEDYPRADRINWRPSIHMPKEAARIFLKVTNVRVERLQCMSWDDICNEGITLDSDIRDKFSFEMLCNKFKNLWNSTIKKSDLDHYGWNANPWVWVIEFEGMVPDV